MFSHRKLSNFPLSAGHKKWQPFFFSCFFNSAPVPCNFCLLCLKRFRLFLRDGEFYLVFRYIWFVYDFSTDKWVIFHFFTKGTEISEKQLTAAAILSDGSLLIILN